MTDVSAPVVVAAPKRDLHRMQRIFRGSKAKLTLRPFNKVAETSLITAVTLTQLKSLTSGLTTEQLASALADSDPVPAVVAELSARAARFGPAVVSGSPVTAENKAVADEQLQKRSERFGGAASTNALEAAISKIDPAVLNARQNRFADPKAAEEKDAADKRAARFGSSTGASESKKAAPAAVVPAPSPVALTAEQQEQIDARARRFGA
eukprot:GILJ01027138.1.p1 GENE.GILJ01027138.1~~GILJ01027138.1.p1  ORF type:complete len:209 (+),score=50.60 GILJ01027138.1:86-712(+)